MTADVLRLASEACAPVAAVCRVLGVARSSVYERRQRPVSSRIQQTAALDVELRAVHQESKQRYGSPRIHQELRRRGIFVSRKRVEVRMRALGLRARRPKRFRTTTEANPAHTPAPNLLDRRFEWDEPNQAWCGDITFVWTEQGWAYLAILIDLCTRGIVGWAVSKHCDAALARSALNAAVARHRPPHGLLHHTDRGSTYTAHDYRDRLRSLGMTESMSRKGNCWDNSVAESTFASIKAELLATWTPRDTADLRTALFPYIERFYNRQRLHSSIGYTTPAEREFEFRSKKVA